MVGASVLTVGTESPQSYARRALRSYNVRDYPYGATGGNVLDDTAALQRAADAVCVAGGRLIIPPGDYKVSADVHLTNPSNVIVDAEGARFMLTAAATAGLIWTGSASRLTVRGLTVVGASVAPTGANGGQTGIGTLIQNAATSADRVNIEDCHVTQCARGIYLDSGSAAALTRVRVTGGSVSNTLGTFSGTGYGICLGSAARSSITDVQVDFATRHSIYVSVSDTVTVRLARVYDHRSGIGTGAGFGMPGVVVARSRNVRVLDSDFRRCEDHALSIEPHDSLTTATTTGFEVRGCTFEDSPHADIQIGSVDPSGTSELADVLITGNRFKRPNSATNGFPSIYGWYAKRARITGNLFRAKQAFTVTWYAVYMRGQSAASFLTDWVVENNDLEASAGAGGFVSDISIGSLLCGSASRIRFRPGTRDVSGNTRLVLPEATITGAGIRIDDCRGAAGLPIDRGDVDTTLAVDDSDTVNYTAPMTAARTVTLPALADSYPGREVVVGRTAAATGAFNLNVNDPSAGVLKSIAGASQYSRFRRGATGWQLAA